MRTAEWRNELDLTDIKQQNVLCPCEWNKKNGKSEHQVRTEDALGTDPRIKN